MQTMENKNTSPMFCFQCEQTANGTGCTRSGVCGKTPPVANEQDALTAKLIALATAAQAHPDDETDRLIIDGLFTTVTNVSFDVDSLAHICDEVDAKRRSYPDAKEIDMRSVWEEEPDLRSLQTLVLFGVRGMAAYAHHARMLGMTDPKVNAFFYRALSAFSAKHSMDEWLALTMETGNVNLACMELLDRANTETYGTPEPTQVSTDIEPGPFIVVSGHDLRDLQLLLEQTAGKGIAVYTHGEMLPAHGYPKLRAHAHLKGNFGTAWQNQQKEFDGLPGPVLFTTNCLMPVKPTYADRIFTTSVVAYPGMVHIGEKKDFAPVIQKALELGGYPEKHSCPGINGGKTLTTGFGHGTVLSVADKVIDAVKAGAIKHFYLVGGCDGARPGRNYYTDFVKATPKDTVILTLACGKFRFNDLDLGTIGGLPRLMDMGQCNDAYSAIRVAVALSEAFGCTVNELPLSLILSWYEQKAVVILLTLLALGIRNIRIGPSLPAFISPGVLKILVDQFGLTPISTPEADLQATLA